MLVGIVMRCLSARPCEPSGLGVLSKDYGFVSVNGLLLCKAAFPVHGGYTSQGEIKTGDEEERIWKSCEQQSQSGSAHPQPTFDL